MMRQAETFSITRLVSVSIRIWGRNLAPVTLIALLFNIPQILLQEVAPPGDGFVELFSAMLLGLLLHGLQVALLSSLIFQSMLGKRTSLVEAYRQTRPALHWALLAILLAYLCISVGLVLLIVPGIVMAVAFWVAVPVAAIEGVRPRAALSRSSDLVSGHGWTVFGAMVLWTGATFGSVFALNPILQEVPILWGILGSWVPLIFFDTVAVIATGVAYCDLRSLKEGVHLDVLREVFE